MANEPSVTRPRSRTPLALLALFALLAAARAVPAGAGSEPPASPAPDNIGHRHHEHKHNPPHPRVRADASRFVTSRSGAVLELPADEDAFFFIVFGDRTGGPVEGVSVLADAVHDVNLLEPDLVMTVGDLVEGYNERGPWLEQMREFKGIMDELLCPWFPVAGNHDIYWRGPNRPPEEHERDYEMHFGPLWYAFEHKDCWFVALYSDEGNPATGERSINEPAAQVMSDAQLSWLEATLDRAKDAAHVFLFLHHPRWIGGGYGDDWERVHARLAAAGNVSAVFAGHIHQMRYDGPRDGIEYVTLATTGGGQSGVVPRAGYLHHYNLVTVRRDRIAMAAVPVGEVLDVRSITPEISAETRRLAGTAPTFAGRLPVRETETVDHRLVVTVDNPSSRPIDVTVRPASSDARWLASPDHDHRVVAPGASATFAFGVGRDAGTIDEAFRPLQVSVRTDYLAEGFRYEIPEILADVPVALEVDARRAPAPAALVLDGRDDWARVDADLFDVPDGPLTLECWLRARSFGDRTGLVTKTESAEYGLFVNGGVPTFLLFLGDRYVQAAADEPLEAGRWHHVAGVYDGLETRLYVDGEARATVVRPGPRRRNELPLIIGGDVDARGRGTSLFDGAVDAVRLSTVARYRTERFTPDRRPSADEHTVLLFNMQATLGPWLYDESGSAAHAVLVGGAAIEEE